MQNVEDTIISQYGRSPTLVQIIQNINTYLDPNANLDQFYNLIWNVDTAQGYGLDVWGRIVGVSRVVHVATGKFLGFEEATTVSADPFNQSPLYSGGAITSNFALSDTAFRLLILARAAANISFGSIPAINAILMALFPGRGNAYCTDGLDMTMTYTFDFTPPLTDVEKAIIATGVLPKPAGVSYTVVEI
jgi:hypothetical protein